MRLDIVEIESANGLYFDVDPISTGIRIIDMLFGIKEVHSKLNSFQTSLCTLTASYLTLVY